MPVVPNDHILVSATVNVDGKDYAFFSVEPDLLYVAVAAGQTGGRTPQHCLLCGDRNSPGHNSAE